MVTSDTLEHGQRSLSRVEILEPPRNSCLIFPLQHMLLLQLHPMVSVRLARKVFR